MSESDVVSRVLSELRRGRFRLESEKKTQADIADALKVLDSRMFTVEREVRIIGGIIDFVVTGIEPQPVLRSMVRRRIGIEVKLKGQPAAIRRQLVGYASDTTLSAIIFATAKPIEIPCVVGVLPVYSVNLGAAWL